MNVSAIPTGHFSSSDRLSGASRHSELPAGAMLITQRNGRIVFQNEAFSALTGLSAPQAAGQYPPCLATGFERDSNFSLLWQNISHSERWSGYLWHQPSAQVLRCRARQMRQPGDTQNTQTHYLVILDSEHQEQGPLLDSDTSHYLDPLCSMPGRRGLQAYLSLQLKAKHEPSPFSVIGIDLHRLEHLHSTLGHDAGDSAMQELARRLLCLTQNVRFIARFSSSRFVIVTDYLGEHLECEQFQSQLDPSLTAPMRVAEHIVHPDLVYGITHGHVHGNTADKLLQNIELALGHAQQKGTCKCTMYSPKLAQQSQRTYNMFENIKTALAKHTFEMHYQPQVAASNGTTCGFEALIRWPTDAGFITPDSFLPVADQFDLMADIDHYVLKQVLFDMQTLDRQGIHLPKVAVNLSDRLIPIATIKALTDAYGIEPHRLEIEITEQMFAGHTPALIDYLASLKALGLTIALDDFGTGYSSLERLMGLPIDKIKIDRKFVQGVEQPGQCRAFLEAIMKLCTVLDKHILAEGVENTQQQTVVSQLGCEFMQGFLFGKAMDRQALATYVRAQRAGVSIAG